MLPGFQLTGVYMRATQALNGLKALNCRQMSSKKTKQIHTGWRIRIRPRENNTTENRKTVIPINNTEDGRRYIKLEINYDTYQPSTTTFPLGFLLYTTHKHTHTYPRTYTNKITYTSFFLFLNKLILSSSWFQLQHPTQQFPNLTKVSNHTTDTRPRTFTISSI